MSYVIYGSKGLYMLFSCSRDTFSTTVGSVMLKAVGQTLFSTGLQNPKYTAAEKQVNVSQTVL